MWYREEMMESTRMVFIRLGNKPLVNGGRGEKCSTKHHLIIDFEVRCFGVTAGKREKKVA